VYYSILYIAARHVHSASKKFITGKSVALTVNMATLYNQIWWQETISNR